MVPLEKNADVLVADDAKPKLAPAGSVSWKYLKQSVEKGELEDLEAHRINSPSKTRLAGGPQKLTRTPFTHEDSMAISIWVAKAEKLGFAARGNEIYEQFAEKVSFRVGISSSLAKCFIESSAYCTIMA